MKLQKLKKGDEIRIIAPSTCYKNVAEDEPKALEKLHELGLNVSFSKNIKCENEFNSSSIEDRLCDLHEAFSDKNVKAIIPATGGFNSNQLLPYIDYELIKHNPKIICGYSDITALNNAIYAKTGMITYSGPNFSTFGIFGDITDYLLSYFKKVTFESDEFEIIPSTKWIDNILAHKQQENYFHNNGFKIINEGKAEGKIVGGNLCTFNLLQGTEFMPNLSNSIVVIEDDYIFDKTETFLLEFERNLQSLLHLSNFKEVKGLLIGRFEQVSGITIEMLRKIIKTKKELANIPIIANVDFGHTAPMITLPIGGSILINATNNSVNIKILNN